MPLRTFLVFLACAVSLSTSSLVRPAYADTKEPPRKTLLWGGDQEGGGPYAYPSDDDPTRIVGFEVDLADTLAAHRGLTASFFQGSWDKMPDLLRAKKCDIILNGYEWTPARLEYMEASLPYYVYALQLMARRDGDVRSWGDLPRGSGQPKRRVGVLGGSSAEQYLEAHWKDRVEIVSYDGSTDAMREVETNKLDATLQDTPIASFYRSRFPALREVDPPVAPGYYVIYARKEDTALVRQINETLVLMIQNGELETILRRYGIWNDAQRELGAIARSGQFYGFPERAVAEVNAGQAGSSSGPGPDILAVALAPRRHGFEVVKTYGAILLQSAGLTVVLSCLSFPLAMLGGLLVALGRLYGPRWLKGPLAAYVEFLRGTPVMLQLYFIFFFLPEVGIAVPAFWTAILGLAVNYSAYESEIYRAGLMAVPKGQMEAALSLGMSRPLALRRIIVPQAMRIVIPPVVNDFIALFKDTSVCSVVTLVELTKRFSVLSQSTQATAELMILTAALYLAMSYPLSLVARRVELHLDRASA